MHSSLPLLGSLLQLTAGALPQGTAMGADAGDAGFLAALTAAGGNTPFTAPTAMAIAEPVGLPAAPITIPAHPGGKAPALPEMAEILPPALADHGTALPPAASTGKNLPPMLPVTEDAAPEASSPVHPVDVPPEEIEAPTAEEPRLPALPDIVPPSRPELAIALAPAIRPREAAGEKPAREESGETSLKAGRPRPARAGTLPLPVTLPAVSANGATATDAIAARPSAAPVAAAPAAVAVQAQPAVPSPAATEVEAPALQRAAATPATAGDIRPQPARREQPAQRGPSHSDQPRAVDNAPRADGAAPTLTVQLAERAPQAPVPAAREQVPPVAAPAPRPAGRFAERELAGLRGPAKPSAQPAMQNAAPAPSPTFAQTVHAAEAQPAAPAAGAQQQVQDLAAIVDRLVAAREAFAPLSAAMVIEHADLGELSLRFDQQRDGSLTVELAGVDAESHRALAGAMAADRGQQGGSDQPGTSQSQPQSQRSASADRDAGGGNAGEQRQEHNQRQRAETQRQNAPRQTAGQPRDGIFA